DGGKRLWDQRHDVTAEGRLCGRQRDLPSALAAGLENLLQALEVAAELTLGQLERALRDHAHHRADLDVDFHGEARSAARRFERVMDLERDRPAARLQVEPARRFVRGDLELRAQVAADELPLL